MAYLGVYGQIPNVPNPTYMQTSAISNMPRMKALILLAPLGLQFKTYLASTDQMVFSGK